MKWGRPIDYHGSRSYGPDEPERSWFGLAGLVKWLKQKVRKPAPRRSSSAILLLNGERHFSLLGASNRRNAPARVADCPFPTTLPPRDNSGFASYLRHED